MVNTCDFTPRDMKFIKLPRWEAFSGNAKAVAGLQKLSRDRRTTLLSQFVKLEAQPLVPDNEQEH
jgi:hypothetical protein